MQLADLLVFLAYFTLVAGYGFWIYHRKRADSVSADEVKAMRWDCEDIRPGGLRDARRTAAGHHAGDRRGPTAELFR